jgi:Holliday junction resolvasome RuvABC DNA-binding subunit
MLLALKGKLAFSRETSPVASAYSDLVEALAGMGYDRRAAAAALDRAEETLPPSLNPAEKEQRLFKQAIAYLSGL